MSEDEREAIRAEGSDPDDPAVCRPRTTSCDGSWRCSRLGKSGVATRRLSATAETIDG